MVPVPAWAGNCRALLSSDIHFSGSPARIIRVAIGLRLGELAEIEREGCRLTRHRTLGFAGNRRDGGTITAPKKGNIHGVSVLVIDDLAALGIVLAQPFAPAYAARAGVGSEAIVMPPLPPASFVPPPCEAFPGSLRDRLEARPGCQSPFGQQLRRSQRSQRTQRTANRQPKKLQFSPRLQTLELSSCSTSCKWLA
jgi:hypothetical protein